MEVSGGAESLTDSIRTGERDEYSQSQNHYWSFRRGDEYILLSRDYVPPLSGGHADLEILPGLGSLRHPELVAVFT
jgi:hypothetical protein